jgi:hypothetical protein
VSDIKLTAPKVRVVMADGSVIDELQTINFDMIVYERTRDKQKPRWPSMEDGRMLWLTFVSWHAAKRTGATAMPWEQWERDALDITLADDDDEDDDESGSPI